nr:MAG TPA: hypothetical protein [Caudoviricetes sp.]
MYSEKDPFFYLSYIKQSALLVSRRAQIYKKPRYKAGFLICTGAGKLLCLRREARQSTGDICSIAFAPF